MARSGNVGETGRPVPGAPVRGSATGRPIMAVLDLLGRRWTLRILWELRHEPLGFRRLQERCDAMSSSVLAQRLRELEEAQVLAADEHGAWGLTALGKDLLESLGPLDAWSRRWGRAMSRRDP